VSNLPRGAMTSLNKLKVCGEAWGVRPWDKNISRWYRDAVSGTLKWERGDLKGDYGPDDGWFRSSNECWMFANYWDAHAYALIVQRGS